MKSKFRSFRGSKWRHGGPRALTMKVWMLKMELCKAVRPVAAESHNVDEGQDPDLYKVSSCSDLDPH